MFHKVGADPEFEVINTDGNVVFASDVLPHDVTEDRNSSHGVGVDGAMNVGEISVLPGSPITVMNSIRDRLQHVADILPEGFDIRGGSGTRYPIGGHVHFSHEVVPNTGLIKALDKFITRPLNSVSDRHIRQDHRYGRMSEYRINGHGWEYRSPPSWLCHPLLAKGSLVIASYLAYMSKQGIDLPTTRAQLINLMPESHRKCIRSYYQLIAHYKHENFNLERLSIFETWRITVRHNRTFTVRYAGDRLDDILGDPPLPQCTMPLNFTGAAERRTPFGERGIFLPENMNRILSPVIQSSMRNLGVMVSTWEVPSIGLSVTLRHDNTLCRSVVEMIINYINRSRR